MTMTMTKSKFRTRYYTNKIKLLVAASSLILIRRAVYMMSVVTLPISFMTPNHIGFAHANESFATTTDSAIVTGTELHPGAASSLNVPVSAAFSDVAGHWAEEAIIEAVRNGSITGYEDGTFRPDTSINLAEFTAVLTRALAIPLAVIPTDPSSPKGYIETMHDAGIIKEGEFERETWNHELTRSSMIKLALRALDPGLTAADEKELTKQAAAAGLLDDEQAILNEKPTTRGEVSVILHRLRKALGVVGPKSAIPQI